MHLYLLQLQIGNLHNKKNSKRTRTLTKEGLTVGGHNSIVITAKDLVTVLTNASKYMDIPAGLKAEEERGINLHKAEEFIALGLRMRNKNNPLKHKAQTYLVLIMSRASSSFSFCQI